MNQKKTAVSTNDILAFECCWCHENASEVKIFNGLYYHPGECLQAAIIRQRLVEAEKEFDTAPDETLE